MQHLKGLIDRRHLPDKPLLWCSLVETYFQQSPGPLEYLDVASTAQPDQQQQASQSSLAELDAPPSAWLLVAAALRGLRRSAQMRSRGGAAPFLSLLRHPQADVRWLAAQAVAVLYNMVRCLLCLDPASRPGHHRFYH